ncbi:hypothetical protein EKL97_15275 [Flavobacterium sp. LS1P28]|uniref:hypothetical protein n=1 Tax=Flavobacterium sp. LS1P28 TaxID=2497752 RepID=UPI000F83803A|nr:hypothetical protein [Flavobacterium sp. LS1P28]RTY77503.1 hypothetical protein EKL97_15275 [Flavobacterium sp. LS1P28]
MKNSFFIVLLVVFSACQSTKIKNDRYKVSSASPELGSIGQSKSLFGLQNDFKVRTLPKLENNIRLSIEVVPFNKRLNHFYKAKTKFNQNQSKLTYIDSLTTKPELTTIRLLDVMGFVSELNADYNTSVFRLLFDTQNSKIISSVAVNLSPEEITKIRQADTYYLINPQDNKYTLSLYKLGKKTDMITINPETIVAFRWSKLCWAISEKGEWYIADMIEGENSCKGNTKSKIKEKSKSKSLFDM